MTLRIGIDIGGTFTDLVAIASDGSIRTHKVASTPADYSEGITNGLVALLTAQPVTEVLHATTVASNAILERTGARTALITTRGFRDVLDIRDLRMPRCYDMGWTKPPALVERRLRVEVSEKTRPDGSIAVPLDRASVDAAITLLRAEHVQSVAITLLHSYANPAHERMLAEAVRAQLPGVAVSVSHEILPEIKEYPRTSTTVVNAFLQPVLAGYIRRLSERLEALNIDAPLQFMQSNGGLAAAEHAATFPARVVESGPAAGVVGAAALATALNEPRLITFDMGGTTAKAGLVEGGNILRAEAIEVGAGVMAGARLLVGAGYMLKLPAIDLAEVGAGGGSICSIDPAGAPVAGPRSAGAVPGPVCYARGGTEPTITDCNLVLGYLDAGGLVGGALKLDAEAARRAVSAKLAARLGLPLERAAHGMLRLASATMMRAIRAVSVERGRDPRDFSMLAFGGNGPLFAAAIAGELGIRRVLIPPMPGLFSALGLLLADTEHHFSRSLRMRADRGDAAALQTALDALRREGMSRLADDGFPSDRCRVEMSVRARYVGQSSDLAVAVTHDDATEFLAILPAAFAKEHEQNYGFRAPPDEPVEMMGIAVLARGIPERPRLPARIAPAVAPAPPMRRAWFPESGWMDMPVIDRATLAAGTRKGPLIVQEYDATALVPPGAEAGVDGFGNIILTL
jgi:N-methylhydantoinase A